MPLLCLILRIPQNITEFLLHPLAETPFMSHVTQFRSILGKMAWGPQDWPILVRIYL